MSSALGHAARAVLICGALRGWGLGLGSFGGALCSLGCASTPAAQRNRTFYDWSLGDGHRDDFERPRPALDWPRDQADPEFKGVDVLDGAVRFSRPHEWLMRNASNEPGAAYVQYVSPNAYTFSLYQRPDTDATWPQIVGPYRDEVKAGGGRVLGGAVPVATSRGQGRAFTVETTLATSAGPLMSQSRELLLRGEHRVVLIQIVHQAGDSPADDPELLRAVGSLEVH